MNAKTSRMFHWPVLVIGVLLIVLPFTVSLPSRASAGQKLLNAFHPIMQPASVRTTVNYDVNTFTPLGPFADGAVKAAPEVPQLIGALATAMHMTPAQVQGFLGAKLPVLSGILTNFPKLVPIFTRVPPGLAFYKPIVDTMQAQVNNYAAVDSLPNFNLFTWFFVIPGILLVLFAGLGLLVARRHS
ncbi:MAG: hypothetical protein ACLQAN_05840 [Acidimicrobiales bacterium]